MTKTAFALAAAMTLAATPSHAFLFLMLGAAAADKPDEPPTVIEGPVLSPDVAIRPEGLPAPFLIEGHADARAMPPLVLAQASNEEILRRLEALERENQELRQQLGGGSETGTKTSRFTLRPEFQAREDAAVRDGLPSASLPMQTIHGWWAHIMPFNPDGDVEGKVPLATYRYPQQTFAPTIGMTPDRGRIRSVGLFKFEGWVRIRTAGTYGFGGRVTCPFEHQCNFAVKIDGVTIYNSSGQRHNDTLLTATRALEPGDYRIEYVFGMAKNRFINYQPHTVTMRPVIRGPNDMNFRDYREDELLVPDRRDVPIGPTFMVRS